VSTGVGGAVARRLAIGEHRFLTGLLPNTFIPAQAGIQFAQDA